MGGGERELVWGSPGAAGLAPHSQNFPIGPLMLIEDYRTFAEMAEARPSQQAATLLHLRVALQQRQPPALLCSLLRQLQDDGSVGEAAQLALLHLLLPPAPLLPRDADYERRVLFAPATCWPGLAAAPCMLPHGQLVHVSADTPRTTLSPRRRVLRALVLAAEQDGREVAEAAMAAYSACLLGRGAAACGSGLAGSDAAGGDCDAGLAAAAGPLLPPPQPGFCYKLWSYAPASQPPALTLQRLERLERRAAERLQRLQQAQSGALKSEEGLDAGAADGSGEPAAVAVTAFDAQHGLLALRVSLNLLEGGTGCHEWEAGFFLAEWLLSRPHLVAGALCLCRSVCAGLELREGDRGGHKGLSCLAHPVLKAKLMCTPDTHLLPHTGRSCLEIGCGAGMVGVALHRCGASSILCTDGDVQATANCRHNLELNGVPVGPRQAAQCRQLLWEDGWAAGGSGGGGPAGGAAPGRHEEEPTVVLGSDLLYDPTVIPALLALLKQVLTAAAAWQSAAEQRKQQQPAAYLATTLRNEATMQLFLEAVEADPAICIQQLAGPAPAAACGADQAAEAAAAETAAAAAAQQGAAGDPLAEAASVRFLHLPELEAARHRIFLHKLTLSHP